MERIEIDSGIETIAILAIPLADRPSGRAAAGAPGWTGARIMVEFSRREPLPAGREVLVRYDLADNGALREFVAVPQYAYTHRLADGGTAHHYRASYWIAPERLMQFVPVPVVIPPAAA